MSSKLTSIKKWIRNYIYKNEKDYYYDIRESMFGITTKRAGWDCLRHYEIAANGTVICFRDLLKKPKTCAPHGLNLSNSISYSNFYDLEKKINSITNTDYQYLQEESFKWVKNNTSSKKARKLIDDYIKFSNYKNKIYFEK